MSIATWVAAIGLLLILYLLLTSIPLSAHVRRLKRQVHVERVRNEWAAARVLMYQMARDGKLSVDSATFSEFVRVQTFILRRPDEYREISQLLMNELLHAGRPDAAAWVKEMPTWPSEMKDVLNHMVAGTGGLILSRGHGRVVFLVGRHILPKLAKYGIVRTYRFLKRLSTVSPSINSDSMLFSAMYRMEHLRMR